MANSGQGYQQFFAELKRRKVFRIMAAYGVIGFGIIEAAEAIFPRVALPDWTVTLVVWLTLLGFPIAIVLAWAFDSTPEGVKRTEDATDAELDEIIAQPASRRWMPGLLALGGAALLFGGWWMGRASGPGADLDFRVADAQASEIRWIAVLPFDDLGGNEEGDPFLGIHVDIHGKLMTLPDLRVTALGSAEKFAGSGLSPSDIADSLRVSYLLLGSVRRADTQARVDVRLTDVAADEDIWADQFDREVTPTNLFAIQSEIAREVAGALEATLTPRDTARLEAGLSTTNPEAINAYLQARAAWGNTALRAYDHVAGPALVAMPLLERAVELAPDFLEAWALQAEILSAETRFRRRAAAPRALRAVERAESLDPKSLAAIRARAWYEFRVEEELNRALSLFQTALSMAPSDVDILTIIGEIQYSLGSYAEGSRTMRRAVFLDPRNADAHANLARPLRNRSMWDAAMSVVDRALAIDPSNEQARREEAWLIAQGDRDPRRALELHSTYDLEPRFDAAFFATLVRDYDKAAAFSRDLIDRASEDGDIGEVAYYLNWLAWVEQARGGDVAIVRDSLTSLLDRGSAQLEDSLGLQTYGRALIIIGREDEGWALIERSLAERRSSPDQARLNSNLWSVARTYAAFGHGENALELLDEAVGKPASEVWSMADLELEPRFDIIRDDPRFAELMRRQQAYEAEQARIAEEEGPWLP